MPLTIQHGIPIAVTAIHALAAPIPAAAVSVLPVPFQRQLQTNWCWAACCQMVFQFNGLMTVTQCNMASSQFGANCCAAPSNGTCNQGNWPDRVYPAYGFQFTRTNASFAMQAVQAEIGARRPLEIYYAWTGGGAHVALVTGFFENGDLQIHDPWYGPGRRTYAFVLSAYGQGAWTITYSQIQRSVRQRGVV